MKHGRRGSLGLKVWISGFILLAGVAAQAQDNNAACSLKGRDTVLSSGTTVRQCLDVASLANKDYVIPRNVTRIDASGFSLCESSVNQGGLADIVYVMDQSGSMQLRNIWISPDQKDTVYLHGVDNCRGAYTNADQNNYGTVTVLRGTGTVQIPRLNPAKDPRVLCVDYWSGDPYYQRDIAFRNAIDFQAVRAPQSRAGYLGFSSGVQGAVTPRQLNTPQAVAQVKANMTINNGGSTNYQASLQQAKTWLNDPALSPNATKAIIFLSDGKPSPDSTAYLSVIQPNGPIKVYGIFMGVPRPDTIRLSDLSKSSGGKFFLIPPDKPDSLRAVVEQILNIIFQQYQPYNAEVRNNSTIPISVATANSSSFVKQENNSWLMRLSNDVAIKADAPNAMRVQDTLREVTSGATLGHTADFNLVATGPEERTNKVLPGTPFQISCVDLPPDINLVKNAYIKDTDGDGAGDKVFFVFSRPLLALPASIDTIYWNKVAPGFNNKVPPKLSFLPGTNNTVVIADLTASPYPKGLTSIPPGETPVGVLPPGGVFLSQRPAIKDSMGPILDSGLARPFDNSKVTGGGALNLDTLVIYVSEKMIAAKGFSNMLLWGKPVNGQCNDFANAKPVVPAKNPEPNGDQTAFTILVQNGASGGPTPVVGDCIYLNVNGDQTDVNYNIPPIRGIQLRGRRPPREIELMRGYPPVVGFNADQPGFLVVNSDPRNGGTTDFSKPNDQGIYEIQWVPPVGWAENKPFTPFIPATPNVLPVGQDITVAQKMPRTISALQIVSTGKYIADVSIFDTQGRFMKSFRQAFGYLGELNNGARVANKGLVSYLIWDMKDSKDQKAGQGVYIWKVLFTFENGKQEIQYTRTGVMRNEWALKP